MSMDAFIIETFYFSLCQAYNEIMVKITVQKCKIQNACKCKQRNNHND